MNKYAILNVEKGVEMEQEKNNNKGVIALLVVIIVILLTFVALLVTGTISFESNESNNNQQTTENDQANTNNENTTIAIQTKLVDNIRCKNSAETFNGISVNIESTSNDGVCDSKVTINSDDITNDTRKMYIESYEFYDNNVIVLSSNTNGLPMMTIYDAKNSKVALKLNIFDTRYTIKSYKTENDKILIEGKSCAGQCSNDSPDAVYPDQNYEIDYLGNGTFSEIRKVN